MACCRSGWSAW